MIRHPRDPIAPHRAVPFLARLVACGLLGRAEALAALLHAAAPANVSPCGRQARLTHALDDATHAHRTAAARGARAALAPLLEARAPRPILLAAATRAASPALRGPEIEALTIEAIARHLRTLRHNRDGALPHATPVHITHLHAAPTA
jgi:predicted component of type VI protein secretion system